MKCFVAASDVLTAKIVAALDGLFDTFVDLAEYRAKPDAESLVLLMQELESCTLAVISFGSSSIYAFLCGAAYGVGVPVVGLSLNGSTLDNAALCTVPTIEKVVEVVHRFLEVSNQQDPEALAEIVVELRAQLLKGAS